MKDKTYKDLNRALIFVSALFLVKAIYLYFLPLPLSYDEAYYWDWSRHIDFGYYSKPPMVAWIIRLSTEILGNTEFAVRLPALICLTLTIFFSYILISKYFNKKNAFLLLVFLSFVPILTVYSFIMTIDPPLLLFWTLALLFFLRYLETPTCKNAIFTGIFIGLGLLTKQTMLAFLVFSIGYLIFSKREFFFKKETLLLYLISLLIYFPNVYWNYTHQFILLKHTEGHFSRKTFSCLSFLRFLGGCTGAYTPLFLGFLYAGFFYLKKFFKKSSSEGLKVLYLFSFPAISGLLLLSYFIKLNINWILPFVLTGFLFLFGYISLSKRWRYFVYGNVIIGIIFSFLIYLLGYFPQKFPEPLQLLLEKLRGWNILAEKVEKYYSKDIPLVTGRRDIAGTLAFYLKEHPEIYVVQYSKFPENQYHIWRDVYTLRGKKVLVVKKGWKVPEYLKSPQNLEKFKIKISKKRYRYFSIWKGIFDLRR